MGESASARPAWRDKGVLAVVAGGGTLGSAARWGVGQALPTRSGHLPWGTETVNVVGCLLLGVLMVLVIELFPASRYLRPFLGVGVLGGFTTFSTAMFDTRDLVAGGDVALAALYLFSSVLCGLLAVWAGIVVTRWALRSGGRPSPDVGPAGGQR
jgi:CrcB protein